MLQHSRSAEMLACSVPGFRSPGCPRRAAPVPPLHLKAQDEKKGGTPPPSPRLRKQGPFTPKPSSNSQPSTPVTKRLLKSRSADSPLVPQPKSKAHLSPCISLDSLPDTSRHPGKNHERSSREGRESPRPSLPSAVRVYRSSSAHRLEASALQICRPRTRHVNLDDRLQFSCRQRSDAEHEGGDKRGPHSPPQSPQKKTSRLLFPPVIRLQGCRDRSGDLEPQHLSPPTFKERASSYSGPSCSGPGNSKMMPTGRKSSQLRPHTPPPLPLRISQRNSSTPKLNVIGVPTDAQRHNQPITMQPESSTRTKILPPISPKPRRKSSLCPSAVNVTTPNTNAVSITTENKDVIRLQPVILDIKFGEILLEPEKHEQRISKKEPARKTERPTERGPSSNAPTGNGGSEKNIEGPDKNVSKGEVVIRDSKLEQENEGCCHGCFKECIGDPPECLLEYLCCDC